MAAERATGSVRLVERKRGYVWFAHFRLPSGRQVQKKLGPAWMDKGRPPAGHFTAKMAEDALRDILTDAGRGLIGAPSIGVTFADAATEYLRFVEDVRRVDAVTVSDYRGVVNGYLIAEFGDMALDKITADHIDAYKERLIADGKLSNRTIVRHLTVLHGIFKRAKRKWGLTDNPASADLVERPPVVYSGEFDALDADELERLAAAADGAQDAAIFKTAAYTGLRQGELIGLRWSCVDFVDSLVHVKGNITRGVEKDYPKSKRVRSVPMIPQLADVLAALKDRGHFTADSDFVFVNETGGFIDHYALRRRFYAALDRAKLRRIKFHDLRHVFGSTAVRGLDPYALQSYMGHQHYSTTQRYLHHKPRPEDAAKIAETFRVTNHVTKREDSVQLSATERN